MYVVHACGADLCELLIYFAPSMFHVFEVSYVLSSSVYIFVGYSGFHVHPQPIQFVEEPTDHLTVPGTDVTFVCTSSQNNTTWLHNNTIIEPGPHYNITSDDHGTSILTVRNVTTDDQGEYHCCVSEWRNKVRSRYSHLTGKLENCLNGMVVMVGTNIWRSNIWLATFFFTW